MNPTSCEISASQSEALAYGTFTSAAYGNGDNIALYVVGKDGKLLGSVHQTEQNVSSGANWSLHAHLFQGFGPPIACYVSIS